MKKYRVLFILFICFFTAINILEAQDNNQHRKLAPTPPMGWNSWNFFGKQNVNETVTIEVIDAMVQSGLKDAGYEYVIIDGGWRDNKLGSNGELLAHPKKFPHGIKPLADYAHSKGLKFGLHTVPGTHDCGGDPVGGFGNEEVQIRQFVEWGVDFIKLDKCKYADGWNEELLKETYSKWHNILEKSGRDIILSVSAYTYRNWNPEVSQMSRTTLDIGADANQGAMFDYEEKQRNFMSVMQVAEENSEFAAHAGNGYWNDPDMLVIGNSGLTLEEQKVHFALWCIMSSPLLLGNDPRNMSDEEKDIITNQLAIAVNQDNSGQGVRIKKVGDSEIWAKQMKDGLVAALLLNRNRKEASSIDLSLSEIGVKGKVKIEDIYSGEKLGSFSDSITKIVEPRSGVFLLISPK